MAVGADVQFYALNDTLQFVYTAHPASGHVFFRLRPPARGGRMLDMTLGEPMTSGMDGMPMDLPMDTGDK